VASSRKPIALTSRTGFCDACYSFNRFPSLLSTSSSRLRTFPVPLPPFPTTVTPLPVLTNPAKALSFSALVPFFFPYSSVMPLSFRVCTCLDLRDLLRARCFSSGVSSDLETRADALGGAKSSSGARRVVAADVGGRADSRVVVGRLLIVLICALGYILSADAL